MINPQSSPPFGAGGSLLRLGGVDCGFVAATGGWAYGKVFEEPPGAANVVGKHLAGVGYEDIVLICTEPPGKALADWIDSTLNGQHTRQAGEIVGVDINGKERSHLSFRNALMTEIAFSAFDATAKDAVQLSLRLAPELTLRKRGSGAKVESVSARQKRWPSNSFRLAIDGLDCTKVRRVDQLVARASVPADTVGDFRDYQHTASHLEISDLVVTLSEDSAASWLDWHQQFVVMGLGNEKNGTLELLAPDLRTALATLSFSGLGIYRLAENTFTSGREAIARVQATMYCERLSLRGPGATGSQSAAGSSAPGAPPPSGAALPSRADVIAPLGAALSPALMARRELLGQLRAR